MTQTADVVRTVIPVSGMTCAACESRVEKVIGRLPGVDSVRASSARGRVEVLGPDELDLAVVSAAVSRMGYSVGRPRWLQRDRGVWVTAVVSVSAVALLAVAAQAAGWSRLSSGVGDLQQGGLLVVLLLGLAAGVSTCMALAGGLILALSAASVARTVRRDPDSSPTALQRLGPVLLFNAGRIVGFAVLGALLGMAGASVTIPTQVLAGLMISVALVMAVLGVRLTELSPRIAGWSLSLPSSWGRSMRLDESAAKGYSGLRAALLGAATFFLPCGFTQATQIYALSTGSPGRAAVIMGTFALGTAPGLLTLGGLPELLPGASRTVVLRGLGILVLLFAFLNGSAGLRLAGIDPLHLTSSDQPALATSNVDVTPTLQTLHTQQVTDGYLPVRSVVYAGIPIRWVVDSVDPSSCAVMLRAPALKVSVALVKGPNTIDLPAQQPGRIMFSCSMGMYGGTITVVPRPAGATG